MIIYNPLDGDPLKGSIQSKPRHCFLMTRLGDLIPPEVIEIRDTISEICHLHSYEIIDASMEVTGRDFLLKIWKLIAASPLCIGICHEEFPTSTQMNIYYELGAAQAMGKEIVLVKSKSTNAKIPSDLIRTEYIEFNDKFKNNFVKFLKSIDEQADYYETTADQLERNPILAIDYLRRAFLITGHDRLRKKAKELLDNTSGLQDRAKNSVEMLIASF